MQFIGNSLDLFPAYIHYNNIRANLFDVFITNHTIRFAAKQAAQLIASAYDKLKNLTGTFIELEIRYSAKLLAVLQINDFFFLKIRKQHTIPDILLFLLLNAECRGLFLNSYI